MTPTLSLSILDLDSGNLLDDVKNKSKYLQYEINIQNEIDFSSKSITRTLMFSFHIHFSLIYFVLFHGPGSCVPRPPECSMFLVDRRVGKFTSRRVLTKSNSANDFLKDHSKNQ